MRKSRLKKPALVERNSGNGTRRGARKTAARRNGKRNARERRRATGRDATQTPRQRAGARGQRKRHRHQPATTGRRGASDAQAKPNRAAASGASREPRGARHDHQRTPARPGRPSDAAGREPGSEHNQGRHYAATAQRAANTAAKRRDAPPRRTGTGGGETGTETTHEAATPAAAGTRRTTQPRHAGGKRRDHDRANAPAPAAEAKRTTATDPDKARAEGRKETPRAEPAQGAKPNRAERSTAEAEGTNEKAATSTPTKQPENPRAPSQPPPGAAEGGPGARQRDREGPPNPPPPRASAEGGERDGPDATGGRKAEAGAGMRPTAKRGQDSPRRLAPERRKGHKRTSPQSAARGATRTKRAQKPGMAGVRGPRPRSTSRDSFRWGAVGRARPLRQGWRRAACQTVLLQRRHGWRRNFPRTGRGQRARRERAAPQGCALVPVAGDPRRIALRESRE